VFKKTGKALIYICRVTMPGWLRGFRRLRARVMDLLLEFMFFVLWLLLFLLLPRRLKTSELRVQKDTTDLDCLRCPIHCSHEPQELYKPDKPVVQRQTPSSHPVNKPVPPLKSNFQKLTCLQIVRLELQKELNKPSSQVDIKRVKQLQERMEKLTEKWRIRSKAQKEARKRKEGKTTKKASKKSIRPKKQTPFLSSPSQKPLLPKSGLRKFTKLQLAYSELNKELSKPSKFVDINRVKKLRKEIEKFEQEWHNRSKAQKQAWKWRKKVAGALEQKLTQDRVQYPVISKQRTESSLQDGKTCLGCLIHCPSGKAIKGGWKGKLHRYLSIIIRWLDTVKTPKDIKTMSLPKVVKWFFLNRIIKYLSYKIKDICLKICNCIIRLIEKWKTI
jgi:hypothetical protein